MGAEGKKRTWIEYPKCLLLEAESENLAQPTESVITDPNRAKVRVRISDREKFGTKKSSQQHNPNKQIDVPSESTKKIRARKSQERPTQKIWEKKTNCIDRQADDVTIVSSRSRISTSCCNVSRALKTIISKLIEDEETFQNRPNPTQIHQFSPHQPIAAPPTQLISTWSSAPQLTLLLRKSKQSIPTTSDTLDSESSWSRKRSKRQNRENGNQ